MNAVKGKAWTRDELIVAINLYCKTPFGKIHVRNPDIIDLAKVLGRSPGSVSYKLANFASIDPTLPRKGASNYSKLDAQVWDEFFVDWDGMAFESEQRAAELLGPGASLLDDIPAAWPDGKETENTVKTRINQRFFRKMILASYDGMCCVTGMGVEELLIASHIVPWRTDRENRMNPQNGLCLNALHDRAFDIGLITVNEDFKVQVSDHIRCLPPTVSRLIVEYHNTELKLPRRFIPDQNFLEYHRTQVFRG